MPVALNYYFPSYGGLIAIDSFKYNIKGEIISDIVTNVLFSQYNNIEHYTYDLKGNVVKVDIAAHNGGTIFNPGYTEFTEANYDNKPNFTAGSIWTKFLLFHSGYSGLPFLWELFSKNNAVNYKWLQDAAGDGLLASSTFSYNTEGFANNINIDFTDILTGEDYGIFTRTSSSTCDAVPFSNQQTEPARPLLFKEKINKNKLGLPSLIR